MAISGGERPARSSSLGESYRREAPAQTKLDCARQRLRMHASQNCFAIPACLSTALAVCRDRIFLSTGKTPFRDRAVPDFMIASARALKVTSMRTESLRHARGVAGHQK